MKRSVLVALIGLGLGILLGGIFVGRATAQQPMYPPPGTPYPQPPGTRFQYQCVKEFPRTWSPEGMARLNQLGAEGWEWAQVMPMNSDVICFKHRF